MSVPVKPAVIGPVTFGVMLDHRQAVYPHTDTAEVPSARRLGGDDT